ncbi:MAG: hypothetical protein PHR52_08165 [Fermentimonas sp.]|jgi:hypothetical protein|nr:hypothetical protein [Fermentimonas sp.]
MFKTDIEKLSFLLGFYLRYRQDGSKISIPNSARKAAVCNDLLKEFECGDVEYNIKGEYIPTGHIVIFKPS